MIAIDLGSNSFRCIEYDCLNKKWGKSFECIVKTADQMYQTQRINGAAQERIIQAIMDAKKVLDFTQEVKAVTTAAMRMAQNSSEVIAAIYEKTGVLFTIIDDEQEAFYTSLAVEKRLQSLKHRADSFVMIDVGGGSTEIMFVHGTARVSKSFPIGIVNVAQQCSTPKEVMHLLGALLKPVKEFVRQFYENVGRVETFVGTAGTPTTMAAYLQGMDYKSYDPQKINGFELTLEGVTQALNGLLGLSEQERAEKVGVGRESLIVAGIIIVQELYHVLGFTSAIVIDDSLREGLAMKHCEAI